MTPETVSRTPASQRWPTATDESERHGVIDRTVIDMLLNLDRAKGASRLARAVSQFKAIAPLRAEAMQKAVCDEDAEALWKAAHALKSSAGALGASQLSRHCGEIESIACEAGIAAARALVAGLGAQLDIALCALDEIEQEAANAHC
jgi:HPt (histidine-containing phosphotransfer) domain-containing protein